MKAAKTEIVSIGNGLYARTRKRTSLLEQYRETQRACVHQHRDPRGMCYRCGDVKVQEVK